MANLPEIITVIKYIANIVRILVLMTKIDPKISLKNENPPQLDD